MLSRDRWLQAWLEDNPFWFRETQARLRQRPSKWRRPVRLGVAWWLASFSLLVLSALPLLIDGRSPLASLGDLLATWAFLAVNWQLFVSCICCWIKGDLSLRREIDLQTLDLLTASPMSEARILQDKWKAIVAPALLDATMAAPWALLLLCRPGTPWWFPLASWLVCAAGIWLTSSSVLLTRPCASQHLLLRSRTWEPYRTSLWILTIALLLPLAPLWVLLIHILDYGDFGAGQVQALAWFWGVTIPFYLVCGAVSWWKLWQKQGISPWHASRPLCPRGLAPLHWRERLLNHWLDGNPFWFRGLQVRRRRQQRWWWWLGSSNLLWLTVTSMSLVPLVMAAAIIGMDGLTSRLHLITSALPYWLMAVASGQLFLVGLESMGRANPQQESLSHTLEVLHSATVGAREVHQRTTAIVLPLLMDVTLAAPWLLLMWCCPALPWWSPMAAYLASMSVVLCNALIGTVFYGQPATQWWRALARISIWLLLILLPLYTFCAVLPKPSTTADFHRISELWLWMTLLYLSVFSWHGRTSALSAEGVSGGLTHRKS